MKVCNRCKEVRPLDAFSANRSKPDGKQGMCRECKRLVDAKHYLENKAKQLARNAANRKKYREEVNKLKNVPCADCKQTYPPYVMDFDHVSGVKLGNVSRMAGNVSAAALLAEVAKCEVVCSNCHRIRTWNRLTGP